MPMTRARQEPGSGAASPRRAAAARLLGGVKSLTLRGEALVRRKLDAVYDRYAGPAPRLTPSVGPCLAIRLDMDSLTGEQLGQVRALQDAVAVRPTCFFLLHQLARYTETIHDLREAGWDIQLHSEARPRAFVTIIRDAPKYGTLITQWRYARKLHRQAGRCARLGFPVAGHSVHGIHQCLDVYNEWSWNIIEWATCRTGFRWMASSRSIYEVHELERRPVTPPYQYPRPGADPLLVFPAAFGDAGFFHTWWEDRLLGGSRPTEAAAREALARRAGECIARGIPLVVNLHPWWWFTDRIDGSTPRPLYPFALVEWLVAHFRNQGLEVLSLSDLYARMVNRGRAA